MFITDSVKKSEELRELTAAVRKGKTPALAWGVPDNLKAALCAALLKETGSKGLVIVPRERLSETVFALKMYFGDGVVTFPEYELVLREVESSYSAQSSQELTALWRISQNNYDVAVTTPAAAMNYVIPKKIFLESIINISPGDEIDINGLVTDLLKLGYTRSDKVEGKGQFSVRGGIVDLFSPQEENPVRIEFYGDEVDTLSYFDLMSQRRGENAENVQIIPATRLLFLDDARKRVLSDIEKLIKKCEKADDDKALSILNEDYERINEGQKIASIDKYLPDIFEEKTCFAQFASEAVPVVFESALVFDRARAADIRFAEDVKALSEQSVPLLKDTYFTPSSEFIEIICNNKAILFESLLHSIAGVEPRSLISVNARNTEGFKGDVKVLWEDVEPLLKAKYSVLIAASNKKHAAYIYEGLLEQGAKNIALSEQVPDDIEKGTASVSVLPTNAGFVLPSASFAVFTSETNTKHAPRKSIRRFKKGADINRIEDLKKGDYVVHSQYGIGVFEGLCTTKIGSTVKDQIKIRYAGSDTLYIPCSRLYLISKYLGGNVEGVKLNRLGRGDFEKTKARVKKAVSDLADKLIALYSDRLTVKGYEFGPDTEWQREFEESFEYEETEDQLRTCDEIKADMEKPRPMDRLLCGDVGVGKTEVALRAAFKCVADNKQVAILVPTTVLAFQHYNTVIKRMKNYPIKVEMLSRFRTKSQQEEIIKKLKTGGVDIIIGTHRLLQKDIVFKDLGLAIVDEEQRFGVSHKERLKEMTRNIDVLTLSATPIPRTLNMALSGIRDMSVIEEPPLDRNPITTYVAQFDYALVADAMAKELARSGQVYYIHNNIETIYKKAQRISELLPDARIGVAHGRMNEEQLSTVWEDMMTHRIDILVCTTIIETGVDIPNVNTLIIENADRMGLSQLHQIRGRVGRSARRAYAYITYNKGKILTEEAAKRLTAIKEFTEFGSGLKIALRDLEIRGAGNVLGAEQHGHMESVGYDMYVSLLKEAISEKKGEMPKKKNCVIDISVSAYIPSEYIESTETRIEMYKKISGIENDEDQSDVIDELCDRFGDLPKETVNLIKTARCKIFAQESGIDEIIQKENLLIFYISEVNLQNISKIVSLYKGRALFTPEKRPYISLRIKGDNIKEMAEFLEDFSKVCVEEV